MTSRGKRSTQLRGGTGVFTGKPAYVWISNQIGNTGVLTGFVQAENTRAFPFNPDPDRYKPTNVTGAPAASVDLAVTDEDFKFPQTWRTNVGVDQRLPWGLTATAELIYNRDVNGLVYYNANLPAAQSTFNGPDQRLRWVGTSCAAATATPCATRLNNVAGNQITNAIVLTNANDGKSWNFAGSVKKNLDAGFGIQAAYSYGEAKTLIDPGSVAAGSFTGNAITNDPNNPALAYAASSPGHRFFINASYTKQFFSFGSTSVSAFWNTFTGGNTSYLFSGDMNGDSATGNDLIYIPRDQLGDELRAVLDDRRGGAHVHRRSADGSLRDLHPERSVPALAPRRVRPAQRGVPAAHHAHGRQRRPGRVQEPARRPPRRADPPRHHQLRQHAELGLGRQPAHPSEPDPDQRDGRRARAGSPTAWRCRTAISSPRRTRPTRASTTST